MFLKTMRINCVKLWAMLVQERSVTIRTVKGTGRFKPLEGANPTIGEVGKLEEVAEERIETVCESDNLSDVLKAIKDVHPYEEPATDVYPIEIFEQYDQVYSPWGF